jgi:hypothetical protein
LVLLRLLHEIPINPYKMEVALEEEEEKMKYIKEVI